VTPERILVRAPNWLGDAVLSLGAVRDVRLNFPTARIEIAARGWVAELYRAVPEVDAVRRTAGFAETVESLSDRYDAALLLTNSFRTALEATLARVPERWCYATDGRGPLLTRRARVPASVRGKSEVYYYRAMLAGLGLRVSDTPDVSLRCPDDWSRRGGELLGDDGARWVAMNPGASFGFAKRWVPERYAEVGDRLVKDAGASVAILGGADERPVAEAIASAMQARAAILAGRTTLPELLGVLSRLSLLVTNDSGPMHLAAALGVPLVAVFGPTDWRETAPFGAPHRLVREDVECAPCKLRECPIDHRCMRLVTAGRVTAAARELLA
jgi:heptosyltransferase-2